MSNLVLPRKKKTGACKRRQIVQRKFCGLSEEGQIASSVVGGPLEGELHEGGIEVDLEDCGSGVSKGTEVGNTGCESMYQDQYSGSTSIFSQCLVHSLYINLAGQRFLSLSYSLFHLVMCCHYPIFPGGYGGLVC